MGDHDLDSNLNEYTLQCNKNLQQDFKLKKRQVEA
jgi:hypothetical protein